MKKPPPRQFNKLTVKRETLRSLAHMELAQVVGGDMALMALTDTCKEMCTSVIVKPVAGG